jgi:hypothetical protein
MKLLLCKIFTGCCSETEVSEQLYWFPGNCVPTASVGPFRAGSVPRFARKRTQNNRLVQGENKFVGNTGFRTDPLNLLQVFIRTFKATELSGTARASGTLPEAATTPKTPAQRPARTATAFNCLNRSRTCCS